MGKFSIKVTVFLLLNALIWSANGKISGHIIDKESGKPLPGVNVLVEGTSSGAATDLNGDYVILNMPPGNYSLQVSYIGYATQLVQGLRVNIDQTTRQNISLFTEALEGEEVIVLAERPMVQKDLTSSQKITTGAEMKELPVESFLGVLTTQAGVNQGADGALHIRGGRSNEIGYYIDGVAMSNPFFTNSLSINVSNKALEEMKVVSGGFNAEYGNAMSGIVNLQIKEGNENYEGSFSAYSGDYFSSDKDIFININDINPVANTIIEGTLSGPVPFIGKGRRLTFNISGRYSDNEGYLYGVREHNPDDFAYFPPSGDWYIEMGGDGKFVPMNPSKKLNGLGKLTFRVTPRLKLSSQILFTKSDWRSYVHSYKYNPDGTYNKANQNTNFSLKLNHAIGQKSYYETNIFYSTTDYSQFVFEDTQDPDYVRTDWINTEPSSATFVFGGTQMGHSYRKSYSSGGKLDFTSQITSRHEIKTGISARTDNLTEENFTVLYSDQYREPTVLEANESPYHNLYENQTLFLSGYVQDKIEYSNFIMNLGVRYDYFDPKSDYITDLLDPEGGTTSADPKKMISPRLGISFPITDEGILHFSYGHFYQLPTLRRLYKTSIFGAGLSPSLGYADLKPEKTVNYEFGLQQQITKVMAIEINIFYKDIRDLLALQSIHYESAKYGPSSYSIYLNKDYGSVQGFTFSLTKRYDPLTKLSAWTDYTYQVADGNSVKSGSFFFNALTGEEEEKRIVPLGWDQRHIMSATIMYGDPRKWSFSFIGKLSSGWPYTPDIPLANYVPESNSDTKPWQKNVNIRFQKTFKIGKFSLVTFIKVYNLFDTRNERYVFDDTGRSGYTFGNQSSQESAGLISHYGELGVHTWSEYMTRPHYYTAPRSASLGFTIEF
jgi:outer membrane receptor protein involved in Fe transport